MNWWEASPEVQLTDDMEEWLKRQAEPKKKPASAPKTPVMATANKPSASAFNPEGSGYDYETAKKLGLVPDASGKWPDRDPKTGLILRGKEHSGFYQQDLVPQKVEMTGKQLSVSYQNRQKIVKGSDGRYYLKGEEKPKETQAATTEIVPTKTQEQQTSPTMLERLGNMATTPYQIGKIAGKAIGDWWSDAPAVDTKESVSRSYLESMSEAWKRGDRDSVISQLKYDASVGLRDEEEVRKAVAEAESIDFNDPITSSNWFSKASKGVARMLPAMIKGLREGGAYGAGLAGITALAGQAGPQAALPEELVTVPAAFGTGMAVGSTMYWYRQGAGDMYWDMRQNGISKTKASILAQAGGVPYALIEQSQIDKIIPGLGKVAKNVVKQSIMKALGKKALKAGINIATEVGEEGLQQIVQDSTTAIGKLLDDKMKLGEIPAESVQIAKNALNTAYESIGPMTLLQLPGGAVGGARTVSQISKAQKAAAIENLPAWIEQNPEEAKRLAAIEKPSRNQWPKSLPRMTGEERANVSAVVKKMLEPKVLRQIKVSEDYQVATEETPPNQPGVLYPAKKEEVAPVAEETKKPTQTVTEIPVTETKEAATTEKKAEVGIPTTKKVEEKPVKRTETEINKMVEDNLDTAKKVANRYKIPGMSKEDIQQEATLLLKKAAETYDKAKGVKFDAWARKVISSKLKTLYTKQQKTVGKEVSIDKAEGEEDIPMVEKLAAPETEEKMGQDEKDILVEAVRGLSERQQALVKGFQEGRTDVELAEELGISKQAVNKQRQKAFATLKNMMESKGIKPSAISKMISDVPVERRFSPSQIQEAIPGAKVTKIADKNGWKVELPNGKSFNVEVSEDIPISIPDLMSAYNVSREEAENMVVKGVTIPSGVRLTLSDGTSVTPSEVMVLIDPKNADNTTARHEALHVAKELGLFETEEGKKVWSALEKEYGDEEGIAAAREAWEGPKGLWERIRRFIKELLANLGFDLDAQTAMAQTFTKEFWAQVAEGSEGMGLAYQTNESISAMDSEYMDAVNSGDMKKAQEMVDEAARMSGYKIKAWHWSPNKKNILLPFTHLGTEEAARKRGRVIGGKGYLHATFLNDEGFIDAIDTGTNTAIDLGFQFGGEELLFKAAHSYLESMTDNELKTVAGMNGIRGNKSEIISELKRAVEEAWDDNKETYDVVKIFGDPREYLNERWEKNAQELILDEIKKDGIYGVKYINEDEDRGSTSYIITNSSDIKSAAPVTYDDNGKVIPLSKRFDYSSPDIRYQAAGQERISGIESKAEKYRHEIEEIRQEIERAEAGYRMPNPASEGKFNYEATFIGVSSTFPKFFQNKGWTKKFALNVIKKIQNGDFKFGVRQQQFVDALMREADTRLSLTEEQMREDRTIEVSAGNLDLRKGDIINLKRDGKISLFTVMEGTDPDVPFGDDEIVLESEDGERFSIDPVFDRLTVVGEVIKPSSQLGAIGISKAEVERIREDIGLDPINSMSSQTWNMWIDSALETLSVDKEAADRLVNELTSSNRPISAREAALLAVHQRMIATAYRKASDDLADAHEIGDSVLAVRLNTDLINQQKKIDVIHAALDKAGTEAGQALNAFKILLAEDMSYEGLSRKARNAQGGKPLDSKQEAEMKELAKKYADLEKKLAEYEARATSAEERLKEIISEDIAHEKKKRIYKPTPKQASKQQKKAKVFAHFKKAFGDNFNDNPFVQAKVKAQAIKKSETGKPSKKQVEITAEQRAVAKEMAEYYALEEGVISFNEFWAQAQLYIKSDSAQYKAVFKEAWDAIENTPEFIAPDLDVTNPGQITRAARSIERRLVENGMTDPDQIVATVQEAMSDILKDKNEARDALTGYGQFTRPSQDEVSQTIRDINAQLLKSTHLDLLEAAKARAEQLLEEGKSEDEIRQILIDENLVLQPTGFLRDKPSNLVRHLTALVNQAKRELPISTKSAEDQLQTAQDAVKRGLRNTLWDLQQQIDDKTRRLRKPSEIETDVEIEDLKAAKEIYMAAYKEMFPPEGATEAQKNAAALKAITKAVDEIQRQVKEYDLEPKPGAKKRSTAEIGAQRERLVAWKAIRDILRDESGITEKLSRLQYEANLRRQIAAQQEFLARGDFAPKPKKEPRIPSKEELRLRKELADAKQESFKKIAEYHRANLSPIGKAGDLAMETAHLTRAIMTSIDLSAVLRQGGIGVMAHPDLARKASIDMLKAFVSKQSEFESAEAIRNHERGYFAIMSGLAITEEEGKIERQEEAFAGRWAKLVPGVAASGRAYSTFLNNLRFAMFNMMVENLGRGGRVTLDEAKVIASYINAATGRSDLKALNKVAANLNGVFFAPRWVVSRFQYLAMPFYVPFMKTSGRVKLAIAKEYARTFAGFGLFVGTLMALGYAASDDDKDKPTFETDPRSSDFLKIKIGDTRIDPTSALSSAIVFSSRFILGETKTAKGEIKKFGEGYKPTTRATLVGQFLRYKMAPIPGAAWTAVDLREYDKSGKKYMTNAVGQKVKLLPTSLKDILSGNTLVGGLFLPLSVREVSDAMTGQDIPTGTALSILALLGASASTYGDKTKFMAATPKERKEIFEKDLKNIQWNDKNPAYSEFLSKKYMNMVHRAKALNAGKRVYQYTMPKPERKEGMSDASYNEKVSKWKEDRTKAISQIKGFPENSKRSVFDAYWKSRGYKTGTDTYYKHLRIMEGLAGDVEAQKSTAKEYISRSKMEDAPTNEARVKLFKKDLKKIQWDSPNPGYYDKLSDKQKAQVREAKQRNAGLRVYQMTKSKPKKDKDMSEQEYQEAVADWKEKSKEAYDKIKALPKSKRKEALDVYWKANGYKIGSKSYQRRLKELENMPF